VSVILSLLAALSYGLADFAGGLSSKRASPWSVALVAQAAGTVLLLAVGLTVGGSPDGTDLAWGVVAGVGNGFGTAFLYRGLASGRMGVVAPVSGVCAAVLPVVVGVVLGERPALLVWIGIVLALPAIWLVAREPGTPVAQQQGAAVASGSLDGILAGAGFGTFFVALAQVDSDAGLLPLTANQLTAMLVIVAVAVSLRQPWVPRERASLGGLVAGALGASATLCFLLASRDGYLSVTAVLASLYPAFTVLLAAVVLREHVHRAQAGGLALCAVAVVLVVVG
jgi:drug/metabolite transporter (DMT)-like permease